jgi:hypothetical protein
VTTSSALWRRLDVPGRDTCRLTVHARGWRLEGTAEFLQDGAPAHLTYLLAGGRTLRTRCGTVKGFVGQTAVDVVVERTTAGVWTFNGTAVAGLEDCQHLDYSFTPATNFPHIRQLDLAEGESADVPVAWLELPCSALQRLPQRYTRRGERTYWYEAPTVGYAAELVIAPDGFVRVYPALWEREDS